jgi:hypothetical protein
LDHIDPSQMGPNPSGNSQLRVLFQTMIFDDPTFHDAKEHEHSAERFSNLVIGFARKLDLLCNTNFQEGKTLFNIMAFLNSFQALGFDSLAKEYEILSRDTKTLQWYREEYLRQSEDTSDNSLSTIFSTQQKFIGQGLRNLRTGNLASVLSGCRVPVILRGHGSFFRLVRPCHMGGVIYGEIMEALQDSTNGLKVDKLLLI